MPSPVGETADHSALSLMPNSRIGVGVLMAQEAHKLYKKSRETWNQHFAYKVTVSEKDSLYAEVHAWLLSITPDENHRSLFVSSRRSGGYYDEDGVEPASKNTPEPPPKLHVQFDDKATRTMIIDGHRVKVTVNKPDPPDGENSRYRRPATIEFVTTTLEAQRAIIGHLERLNAQGRKVRKAVLRMVGTWGDWRTRSDIPPRSLDSVSLPSAQKSRITDDLGHFLDSEDQYNRLAIPWHRGYMLHGPPGTGKTSMVKALANHFNLDLWYVSLSDLNGESSLLSLVADVGPRSILLLEDIDTLRITREGEEAGDKSITIGGLLNTLDGVGTPHGLVTFMTTNNFEKLDQRLVRAGRMDMVELLGYPDNDAIRDLFMHFFGHYLPGLPDEGIRQTISAAAISEIFKRNLSDHRKAQAELLAALK